MFFPSLHDKVVIWLLRHIVIMGRDAIYAGFEAEVENMENGHMSRGHEL